MIRRDLLDPRAESKLDAAFLENLAGVLVRPVRKPVQDHVSKIDDLHGRPIHGQVAVLIGHRFVDQVRHRPGELRPRRAGTNDHEIERSLVEQRRVAIGILEHGEHSASQPLGVSQRVQRERSAPPHPGC